MNPRLQQQIAAARAAGYSDQEIQSYLGAPQPAQSTGRRTLQMPGESNAAFRSQGGAAPRKKSFILDQISTAGGILGGIGGSFIAPIAGTAAGAGAGSALGEAIENAIMGESLGKNVAKEGALGAVFGAGPIKLLKGAGAGVKALATGADDVAGAASRAATTSVFNRGARASTPILSSVQGASDDGVQVINQTLKTSVPGKMNALGNKALASQYGTIGKNVARETDPINTISQLADIGILKPVDAERIAASITGSNGLLTKAVANAASGSRPVGTYGIRGVLRNAITENGLVEKEAKSIVNTVNAQLKVIQEQGGAPSVILKAMRNLEKRAANLQGKGGNYRMATPERVDQANVLLAVRNELQDRLYKTAGGNKNLQNVLTPELREQLISLSPGNPKWQSFVDNNIMTATDIGALRSAQAPFVRVGKIIDEGDVNSMTFGGRGGFASGGGTVANTIINAGTEFVKKPAARAISAPLRGANIGNPIVNPGAGNQGVRGALGIGARVGLSGLLGSDQSSGPNILSNNTMTNAMQNSAPNMMNNETISGQSYNDLSTGSSMSMFAPENIESNIQQIVANGGDLSDVTQYLKIAETVNKLTGSTTGKSNMSQSSKNSLASSDNAINTVNQLEQLFTNAGSGSGRLGGTLKGWAATAGLDEDAKIYDSLANASVTQIAKALAGSGAGTVSDMDAKVIMAALPTLRDTPAEARAKFAALKQRLETAKNNSLIYGGGAAQEPASLEDALMQYQSGY